LGNNGNRGKLGNHKVAPATKNESGDNKAVTSVVAICYREKLHKQGLKQDFIFVQCICNAYENSKF
jgi:hypothetical protein